MAVGDAPDFLSRLRSQIPRGWLPDDSPVADGVMSGLAAAWAVLWSGLVYVRQQTRIATATGGNLDVIALDVFGLRIGRRDNEEDGSFRGRIRRELLRPKATRAALAAALTDLTGFEPKIFEPANASDTGGYGVGMGYGVAGAYGSRVLPFQALVTAFRPPRDGTPGVDGYGGYLGGYGVGALVYSPGAAVGTVDQEIRDTVLSTIPAATVVWLRITNLPPVIGSRLSIDFYLDRSALG